MKKFKIGNKIITANDAVEALKKYRNKMKETNSFEDDDIENLSEEEKQAIEDYRKAISNTTSPKLLKLFGHILKEEVEHLEELQSGKLEDSIKDGASNSDYDSLLRKLTRDDLYYITYGDYPRWPVTEPKEEIFEDAIVPFLRLSEQNKLKLLQKLERDADTPTSKKINAFIARFFKK